VPAASIARAASAQAAVWSLDVLLSVLLPVLLLLHHGGSSFAAGCTNNPSTHQLKTCRADNAQQSICGRTVAGDFRCSRSSAEGYQSRVRGFLDVEGPSCGGGLLLQLAGIDGAYKLAATNDRMRRAAMNDYMARSPAMTKSESFSSKRSPDERSDIRGRRHTFIPGFRGACHRAALRADPLAPSGLRY
jgi:hypothetical protein